MCYERFFTEVEKISLSFVIFTLGDPGTDSGGEGKSKRAEKYGTKKSKERQENLCFSGSNQKSERRRPFGTDLVRHGPQGLFLPFHQYKTLLQMGSFSIPTTFALYTSMAAVSLFRN